MSNFEGFAGLRFKAFSDMSGWTLSKDMSTQEFRNLWGEVIQTSGVQDMRHSSGVVADPVTPVASLPKPRSSELRRQAPSDSPYDRKFEKSVSKSDLAASALRNGLDVDAVLRAFDDSAGISKVKVPKRIDLIRFNELEADVRYFRTLCDDLRFQLAAAEHAAELLVERERESAEALADLRAKLLSHNLK